MNNDELKQKCSENGINHRNIDGKTLRALRLKLDVTQRQMAENLGVSLPMYSLYERGKTLISKPVSMLAQKLIPSNSGNEQ